MKRHVLIAISVAVVFLLTACPYVQRQNDASLTGISISGNPLENFNPQVNEYTVELAAGTVQAPIVTVTPSVEGVVIDIDNAETLPGTTTITVTALNGKDRLFYHIHFTVQKSTDSSLSSLLYNGTAVTGFTPERFDYEVILPPEVLFPPVVSGITNNPMASIEVVQAATLPGTATLIVTAEDGETTSTYRVIFIPSYRIELLCDPEDGGNAIGAGVFVHGDTVNLSISINEGYEFAGWTEDGVQVSGDPNYSFEARGNRTLVANFTQKTYTLTINVTGQGAVTRNPDKATYAHGEIVQLTSNPSEGWSFTGWSGDLSGSTNPINITMNADRNVTASFSSIQYAIAVSANPEIGGTVTGNGTYDHGETVNLTALANPGYSFVNWTEDGVQVSGDPDYSFEAIGNRTLVANFTQKTYTLTINVTGQGAVTRNPDKATYAHGEIVQLTSNPSEGWSFTGWSGDLSGSTNPINITMNADRNVTASFSSIQYAIAVSANPEIGGTVTGNGTYDHGETVNLTALANPGYSFVNWTEDGVQVSGDPDYSFEAIGNRTLVANFTQKTYTLTINITGQGTVSRNPDKPTYAHGEIVRLTASPATNWNFKGWSGDLSGSTNPVNITMNADRNVTATFSTIQYTIAISANPEAGGTVTGGGIYNHGETVNLTALANRDYRFVNWTEAGIQVSTNSNYSFTARSDRTLVANFEEEVETGAFKVANSWGIGGWENVPDGFLYITYEAMKKNRVVCFITDPRNGYEPRAIAVFEISHPVRDDCRVYVGVGDPASPLREKSFDVYDPDYRGGPLPFPENKMVLDITELLPFNDETVYLKVSDSSKTSSTGVIESFSVEVYNNYPSGIPTDVFTSTQTPKNTVNDSSVNVQIPSVTYASSPFYDLQYDGGAGISPELLARMKEQMGIYEEGVNYNEIIDGFGTGLRPPTEEEWEEISINWREAKGFIVQDALPAMIDYSSSIYFPPIGNQGSEGSCVAFSIGYYISTFYEARDRGWNLSGAQWVGDSKGSPTNSYQNRIFSPDFIYHQINNGVDEGAHYVNAMKVISNIGISSWKEMPYSTSDHTSWPSEPAWREAPRYRSHSSVMEVLQIASDKDILTLKSYVNSGYLISISIDANKYSSMTSNDVWNSYNYTNVRTNHANTIVGYDDSMSR